MRKNMVILAVVAVLLALPAVALAQTGQGTGTVHAEGDGTAYLRGEGWVRISGNGTLVIRDRAGDAEIQVSGHGSHAGRGQGLVYRGWNGEAYVRGSAITVAVRGTDIRLEAAGTGVVYLRGQGWYTFGGEQRAWTAQGVQLDLAPQTPASAAP